MGALTPDTFQQAIFQLFQESERRRMSCLQEAEDHLRKYHALLSQAGAFAAQGSILFAVINGFASLEEKRVEETAVRAKEQAEKEAALKASEEAARKAAEIPSAPVLSTPDSAPVVAVSSNISPPPAPLKPSVGTLKTSGGRRKRP
jgi:hypothetical protein